MKAPFRLLQGLFIRHVRYITHIEPGKSLVVCPTVRHIQSDRIKTHGQLAWGGGGWGE